jgi:protein-arginine deiminase
MLSRLQPRTFVVLVFATACLNTAGCSPTVESDDPGADFRRAAGKADGLDGGQDTPPVPLPDVDLVVDANRNGSLDRADWADDQGEDQWSLAEGAVFLVNIDDDDSDKVADAADAVVNGSADEEDLARIQVAAWPTAPDGTTGALTVDPTAVGYVRMFRHDAAGWTVLDLRSPVLLTADEIRAGLELGIEARDFVRSTTQPWQGVVTVELSVQALGKPLGQDTVQLKASPWLVNHNMRAFDRAYFSGFSNRLTSTLPPLLAQAGLTVTHLPDNDTTGTTDIWYEDWMQTGWTAMPKVGGGGAVHGMVVFNARPWGRAFGNEPIKVLRRSFLGPDRAVAAFYNEQTELNTGSTFDSHGNHDALPPSPDAPMGWIFTGANVIRSTREFYAAQVAQPVVALDTSWLAVGHIDEVYAPIQATTARGYKVVENSPALAKSLFQQWKAQGNGQAKIFPGMTDFNGAAWETTVDAMLADPVLMAWNQEAQVQIDSMRAQLKSVTGMTDSDIVPVPVLYEEIDGGKVARLPDTANVRVVGGGDIAIFPKTFGPYAAGGQDLFKNFLESHLKDPTKQLGSTNGLTIQFGDSWDYHVLLGDIHCASNWSAPPQDDETQWWEAGQ